MNKRAETFFKRLFVFVIIGVALYAAFAIAGHAIDAGTGGVFPAVGNFYNFNQTSNANLSGNFFNVTINNTDYTGESGNITNINITISGNFSFIANTNGSSLLGGGSNFTNTTTVLSWWNETGLVANATRSDFFFNISTPIPGYYNVSVNVYNASGFLNQTNI